MSAGLFLALLGMMSYSKFTLGENIPRARKQFYRICGLIIWASIAILIVLFIIDALLFDDKLNCHFPAYVFWFELIAVWTFGVAWLVKGKFNRDCKEMLQKISVD